MSDSAKLFYKGQEFEFPVIVGTENEPAIDIAKLRSDTGLITLDSGFKNTGSTTSSITFLDGEEGILRYRGYRIEDLAEKSSFMEVAYLLIYGELPTQAQFDDFTKQITYHTLVHEDIKKILDGFPSNAHPMGVLSSLICSLSAFYPDSLNPNSTPEEVNLSMIRLLAKMPTFAAWAYKNKMGHPVNYPDNSLDYCSNFLKMMFALPAERYEVDPVVAKALDALLILMGFGHRVYKNFDPRAKIIKKAADDVLTKLGVKDPILDIAKELEFAALNDPYFVDKKLYPNVDFYSGIIYRALGIPTDMFTVMFALGRLPGWIAQWKEMTEKGEPIGRPRQVYSGATERDYVTMTKR